jgi:hypothetical protein
MRSDGGSPQRLCRESASRWGGVVFVLRYAVPRAGRRSAATSVPFPFSSTQNAALKSLATASPDCGKSVL